jgi:cell division protease FtsH
VGHALISALQKNSEPVQKITIVPRTMGALGYVMHVPEEEKYLNTEAELRDMLVSLLGGRAAEEIVFDTVTTGAANDIEKATDIARSMVTQYGMSKRFGLMGLATVQNKYLDGSATLDCSDVTAAEVDEEVMKLLKDSYKTAKRMLKDNREIMDKLAEFLIEKETITGKEFMEIYRKIKGIPEPEEEKNDEKKGKKTGDKEEQEEKPAEMKTENSEDPNKDLPEETPVPTDLPEHGLLPEEPSPDSSADNFADDAEGSRDVGEDNRRNQDWSGEQPIGRRGNYSGVSRDSLWRDNEK